MKKLRIVLVWSIFCILIECLVLLYADKILFKHSSDFTVKQVSSEDDLKTEYKVSVPSDAEDIESSYNGRYLTYYDDGALYLVDAKTEEKQQIFEGDSDVDQVLNAKWLPDRNILVAAVKQKNDNNKTVISFKNYDAKNKESKSISEICTYESGMKVDDITTTTLSGVSYVAVGRKNNTSVIYRIDINDNTKKVTTKANKVGSMQIFPHEDTLVYEDKVSNRYYSYSNDKTKRIDLSKYGNVELLSLDNSGNVYVGQVQNKKIVSVLCGNYKESTSKWKSKKLDSPKEIQDVYVNSNKQVLVNQNSEVVNLDTNEKVEYTGKLLAIKDNVVCSKDGNTVYLKKI